MRDESLKRGVWLAFAMALLVSSTGCSGPNDGDAPFLVGNWTCREGDGEEEVRPFFSSAFRIANGPQKRRCERPIVIPDVADPALATGFAGAQPSGQVGVWLDDVCVVDGAAPYTGDPVHLLPRSMVGPHMLIVEIEAREGAFVASTPVRFWRVGSARTVGRLVHGELVVDLVVSLITMLLAIPVAVGAALLARRLRREAITMAVLAFSGFALGLIRLHDNAFHPLLGIPPFALTAIRLPIGILGVGALYELSRRVADPPYSRVLRWGLVPFAAAAFARVVHPSQPVLIVTNYVNLLIFPMGLLSSYALLRKSPKGPREWIGLCAIVTVVAAFGTRQIGLGGTTTPDFLGFANLAVFILLAVVVSLDVSATLARLYDEVRAKVGELATRSRTIESLNVELRRQIVDKSRDLGAVLRLLPTVTTERHQLSPGSTVALYSVIRRIGAGGMGEVYEVKKRDDPTRYALKVMSGAMSGHVAARFAREAEIAARLGHRCLVSVVDMGLGEWGGPYLVMEYVDGWCLEDLRTTQFGNLVWAIDVLHEVTLGLVELHAQGVVHRDLKPANILLAKGEDSLRGRVKIADFGISRIDEDLTPPLPIPTEDDGKNDGPASTVDQYGATMAPDTVGGPPPGTSKSDDSSHVSELTVGGALLGTPLYMAPELTEGQSTTASDVFALALVAWELVTGRYPFGEPPLLRATRGVPALAPEAPPTMPASLAKALLACLDPDPSKRLTAAELLDVVAQLEIECIDAATAPHH